jgi:copper transport protein
VRRRPAALLVALLMALGTILLIAAPSASAHATVVTSTPADGSRLSAAPASVSITFDESVGLNRVGYLKVINQSGDSVTTSTAVHPGGDGTKVAVNLRTGLGDGTYIASYRVISADSHPVTGTVRFVVGSGALAPAPAQQSAADNTTSVTFDVVRWVSFVGLILLGGAWLMCTVWPEGRDDNRARRLLWAGWWVTVAAALAEMLVQGPYSAGESVWHLFTPDLIDSTLHSTFGTAHSIRLVLLGVLGVELTTLLRTPSGIRARNPSALLAVGIAVTYAYSGHPAAQDPTWLAVPSTTLHLAAMATWIGGLLYLVVAILPRAEPDELHRALPVFSKVAYVSVVVLLVTGTYQAWLGVGTFSALYDTRYGQLVLVKAGLFIVIVALGNVSRIAISKRVTGVDIRRLRSGVLIEVVLALGVLGATAVLVAEPLGRAAAITQASKPESATAQLGNGRTALITITPHRAGPVAVTVALSSGATPTSLTLTASLASKQLGPITVPLSTTDHKTYDASGVLLPSAGKWDFVLIVQTSQFDSVTTDVHLSLK